MRSFVRHLAVTCGALAWAGMVSGLAFADAPNEVHGSGDAYAGQGVAMAWGILRGADEASTLVVLRIVADPSVYSAIAVVARNPFNGQVRKALEATSTSGAVTARVPRAQYGDFPRTEVRLYGSAAAAERDAPSSTVFYLGVPDTTPEFANEAALESSLADRIARARASIGKKP